MDIALIVLLVLALLFALLLMGRSQIAKGANVSVANGSVLLVLATVVGVLPPAWISSLNVG